MDGRRPVRYEPYWEGEAGAPQWGGGYTTTDGQRVTEGDATAMAEALALALQEIPARDETALREARNRVDDAVEKAAIFDVKYADYYGTGEMPQPAQTRILRRSRWEF